MQQIETAPRPPEAQEQTGGRRGAGEGRDTPDREVWRLTCWSLGPDYGNGGASPSWGHPPAPESGLEETHLQALELPIPMLDPQNLQKESQALTLKGWLCSYTICTERELNFGLQCSYNITPLVLTRASCPEMR